MFAYERQWESIMQVFYDSWRLPNFGWLWS